MWYLIFSLVLTCWVAFDAGPRNANIFAWAGGTLLLAPVVLPIYFAVRPLKAGESREGGRGWNLLKNFSMVWTLLMAVATVWSFVAVSQDFSKFNSPAEQAGAAIGTTLGLGFMAAIWFFPVLGALVLGLLLKKSSMVEKGPTGAMVGSDRASEGGTDEKFTQKKIKKYIVPIAVSVAGVLLIYLAVSVLGKTSHGYSLQPRDSAALLWLLNDDQASYQNGSASEFFGIDLISASALDVARAYEQNQVGADQKYFQKRLKVTGTIESINSGLGNEPYIALRGTNLFLSPQIHFKDANAGRVGALKKGQTLTFICDGDGAIAGAPMFQNCLFLDEYADKEKADLQRRVRDFLAGRPETDSIGLLAVMSVVIGRALPESSTCFTDGSACVADMTAVLSEKDRFRTTTINVINELKAKGITIPDSVTKKAHPAGQDPS